jgi:aminoglycoside phosphotransferase (APT) family kinase protein
MTAVATGPALGTLVRDIVRDHLPGRQTRTVVVAMSKDANPKATVMVFVDGAPSPLLALKVGLTEGACRSVEAEARALRALAAVDPTMVHHTAPRCLELRDGPLGTALVMSARAGIPMNIDYHRWRHNSQPERVGRDFARADRWLRQLALRTGPPAVPLRWADAIRARFASDVAGEYVAVAIQSIEGELERPDLCAVVHGDFWCGNILHTAGVVSGVVDWEHAVVGGDPVRDRARFALSYSLYLDRHTRAGSPVHGHAGLRAGRWGAGIGYAVQGQGWYPELVAEFVGDGLETTGRSPDLWRAAMLSGLAEIVVRSDHDGFARQHLELLGELVA